MVSRRLQFSYIGKRVLAELELELTDGKRVSASYDSGVPASDVDEQGRRLEEKFASLAEPIIGSAKTRELIGEIARLDTLADLRGVMRLCEA